MPRAWKGRAPSPYHVLVGVVGSLYLLNKAMIFKEAAETERLMFLFFCFLDFCLYWNIVELQYVLVSGV